jgi:lycopene cyclase domain-containing protein
MRHLIYVAVLGGCLVAAVWLEPVLRLGVFRQWRRLLVTLAVVATAFCAWDIAAIDAGHWRYDRRQMLPVTLLGHLPLDELLFFLVVPLCTILGFEAVHKVLGWSVGDEDES